MLLRDCDALIRQCAQLVETALDILQDWQMPQVAQAEVINPLIPMNNNIHYSLRWGLIQWG
ncbi:MAG: hypothetical protein EBT78_09855 [Betaproteobacteria bacterium]|nr:hypothetical protein [Betaproteobacteria bacterium]